jgi:formyltetrahydrofolate deformylase
VTSDLDEGPIIEQAVERVDHTYRPEHLVAAGRDTECMALARAVRYHIEHRVFLTGNKTVVFR